MNMQSSNISKLSQSQDDEHSCKKNEIDFNMVCLSYNVCVVLKSALGIKTNFNDKKTNPIKTSGMIKCI
jgi:hypothetical protein